MPHLGEESGEESMEYLKSRVEDQSVLIAMMKQRADKNMATIQQLSEAEKAFDVERRKHEEEIALLKKEVLQLRERFNQLSSNHEELEKFRKQYKAERDSLSTENETIRARVNPLFAENEDLRQTSTNLKKELTRVTSLLDETSRERQKAAETVSSQDNEMVTMKRRTQELETVIQALKTENKARSLEVVEYQKQLKAAAAFEVSAQDERLRCSDLQSNCKKLKAECGQMKEQLEKQKAEHEKKIEELKSELTELREEAEKVSKDAYVKKLLERVQAAEERTERHKHAEAQARSLLKRERNMNTELQRNLSSIWSMRQNASPETRKQTNK